MHTIGKDVTVRVLNSYDRTSQLGGWRRRRSIPDMRKNYDFWSFFVIPALTFLMTAGYELTATNFSVIGNREGRRGLFLLWGAVTGNYFYLYVKDLTELGGCEDRLVQVCLSLSFVLFLCGVSLPYLPGRVPVISRLHVWASFGGPAFLFVCLYRLIRVTEQKEGVRLFGQKVFHFGVGAISAFLYLRIGIVSSLLEIFVTLSACVSLSSFQHKLEKIRLSNH